MNLKSLLLATMLVMAVVPASYAKEPPSAIPEQPASARSTEDALVEHKHYTNKKGNVVHSPAHTKTGKAPDGASAQCGDGSYSFSQNHRGTCSHHGGVVRWIH